MATKNPLLLRAQQQRYRAKYRGTPHLRYKAHRSNAKQRGIPFLLTFDEWWSIWEASGHWEECGRGSGYSMARFGDEGAYEVGNVSIISGADNSREAALRSKFWTHSYEHYDLSPDHKRCPRCERILLQSEFNKDRYKPSGLSAHCRSCSSQRCREYYQKRVAA